MGTVRLRFGAAASTVVLVVLPTVIAPIGSSAVWAAAPGEHRARKHRADEAHELQARADGAFDELGVITLPRVPWTQPRA